MLSNLLASIMIITGVFNSTPVYKSKENNTKTREISTVYYDLRPTYTSNQTYVDTYTIAQNNFTTNSNDNLMKLSGVKVDYDIDEVQYASPPEGWRYAVLTKIDKPGSINIESSVTYGYLFGFNYQNLTQRLTYTYETYVSYENTWANYITNLDITATGNQTIANVYNAITNPNNSYTYQVYTNTDVKTLYSSNTQGLSNTTVEYTLNPSNATYMFTFVKITSDNQPPNYPTENFTGYNQSIIYEFTNYPPNAQIEYEVIDLPGLMFNILTMPFTFISTAFNLTLFPGTQYQVNLSNLFLAIFAVLVFAFIIKNLMKAS